MRGRSGWSWALDIALAVVIVAVGLAEVWVPFESVQGQGSATASSLAIVLCGVALVFRRAYPLVLVAVPATWVAVAVASGGDIQVLFFGQLVPMYFALYCGARYGTPRVMAIVCGSVVVGVLLADLTVPALQTPNELFFHWAVLIAVFALGWGMRLAERRAIAAGRRASEAESTAREQALRAIADERSRIARELHDVLGHSVSVIVVQAGAAAQAVDDDPEFVRRALETIRSTGAQSLAEMRRVVTLLRDDEEAQLGPQPGMAQVPALIASMRASGLDVDYVVTGATDELGAGQQLAVYRIVQEALTNVARHAPESRATVTVER
jgi:signal transduction histidine kinase